tara:strand:+ start:398 stop:592 length:195 start_codon:yes stop_codon:yes gene_type:complete
MEEIARKVLYAAYQKETPAKIRNVITILEIDEIDSTSKATEICDMLGIPRRTNRAEIRKVLNSL